ncbi:MAG: hypothetical protein WCP85_21790 [Mariniphaga sp.]
MDTIELKRNFHLLIDSIDNENLLINFYEIIKKRSSQKDGQLWNRLNDFDKEELITAYDESQDPENLISHSEMKRKK